MYFVKMHSILEFNPLCAGHIWPAGRMLCMPVLTQWRSWLCLPPLLLSNLKRIFINLDSQLDDYDPRGSHSTRKRKRRRGGASGGVSLRSMRVAASPPPVSMSSPGSLELLELRKKKLRLECTKLELEIEKLPLECAKLELEIQKLQRDLLSGHHNVL